MHLRQWALAATLLAVLAVPATAQASVGVGIQAGPVQLAGPAHPGGQYALPPVYVVDTGTQSETLTVRIERLSPGRARSVPAGWISQGPAVRLSHGQSARIPLELIVPATAKPGQYLTDVVVKGSAAVSAGGANIDVAAATKVEFRIVPGMAGGSWFSVPGWLLPGIGVVLLIAGAAIVARRLGVRIQIDREAGAAGLLRAGRGSDAG